MLPALLAAALLAAAPDSVTWRFDRLDRIGGHPATAVGRPTLIDTPAGKAIHFDGVGDGIFLDVHPLAGARAFTWEVVFRPESGGGAAQRFFHLQEAGSTTRLLLEIRLIDNQWCLDSFANSAGVGKTLIDRTRLHPLDRWYHVAFVYDGRELRHYVDGVLQGAAEAALAPQGAGRTSIGVRINQVDYFKGAIRLARMTRRALPPEQFLRVSSK